MTCKKFRIVEWLNETKIVYTPQEKCYLFGFIPFWCDIKTENESFLALYGERGYCSTKEGARKVIDEEKARLIRAEEYKKECQAARFKFGKGEKFTCADE